MRESRKIETKAEIQRRLAHLDCLEAKVINE
jgi:hypothetical protein